MLTISTRGLQAYEAKLVAIKSRALPFAVRNTLNGAAFVTRSASVVKVKSDMTVRNKWTERNMQVERARGYDMSRFEAKAGSRLDYMATQEFGGVRRKKHKHGVPIPTSYSAGQSENARPRTRLPRKPNRLANLTLSRRQRKASSPKQRLLVAVNMAVQTGKRALFLGTPEGIKTQGIYRVLGGRKTKRGWPRGARLKMLYSLEEDAVTIPRSPWLEPSTNVGKRAIPKLYAKAIRQQLARLSR